MPMIFHSAKMLSCRAREQLVVWSTAHHRSWLALSSAASCLTRWRKAVSLDWWDSVPVWEAGCRRVCACACVCVCVCVCVCREGEEVE